MSTLPLPDHPRAWRRAVLPNDIGPGRLTEVPGGAVTATARADALVSFDEAEVSRRVGLGCVPVTSLGALDALLNLPLRHPVRIEDLSAREERTLRALPSGCVEFGSGHVTRHLQPPLTVVATIVTASRWLMGRRRVAAFFPFAQQIVVLPHAPSASVALEAEFLGVGIWVANDGERSVCVPSAPFVRRYVKAAGWRFSESSLRSAHAQGLVTPSTVDGLCEQKQRTSASGRRRRC